MRWAVARRGWVFVHDQCQVSRFRLAEKAVDYLWEDIYSIEGGNLEDKGPGGGCGATERVLAELW